MGAIERMFVAKSVTDDDFTDKLWKMYFDVVMSIKKKYRLPASATNWEEFKKRILTYLEKEKDCRRYAVLDNGRQVGWIDIMGQNMRTENQRVYAGFNADFDKIPEEISKLAAGRIAEYMEDYNCSKVFSTVHDKRLETVVRSWNGEQLSQFNEYVLYRDKADMARLKKWMDEIPLRHKDLSIKFYEEIPDEYLESFARLLEATLYDMPEEREGGMNFHVDVKELKDQSRWRKENQMPTYKHLIFNESGEIVGLTIAEVSLSNPRTALQFMTGIKGEYRGRGLSKWLKAAMFFKLGELFPENRKVITWMRAVNEPIQHINKLMGYVLESQGYEFKITKPELEKYLGQRTEPGRN